LTGAPHEGQGAVYWRWVPVVSVMSQDEGVVCFKSQIGL
jgi:hypothetical protein